MVAYADAVPEAVSTRVSIETMRAMVVVLLVSFHVIGSGDGGGLDIAYPHMLRLYADFFIYLRMPFSRSSQGTSMRLDRRLQRHNRIF